MADGPGMLLIGFLISLYIAYAAEKKQALTPGGALAAVVVGTVLLGLGGGVSGLALLAFFLTSTALSRYRKEEKERLTGELVEKGSRRDAAQVFANGGPATAFCLLTILTGSDAFAVGVLGALAAANADTWATEIGLLSPTQPRHILTFKEVPAGTSGAVSPTGLLGLLAGALFIGFIALWEPGHGTLLRTLIVTLGGAAGGIIDSLLGATIQEQRRCLRCGAATEQAYHYCGEARHETMCTGGVQGIDNDTVNALSTALGGTVSALLYSAWMS